MPPTTKNVFSFLPFILFSILSGLGAKSIFGHLFSSGLAATIRAQCPELPTSLNNTEYPYRLAYTSYDSLDAHLCGFVTFFQFALQPNEKEPLPGLFIRYFCGGGLPALVFWATETYRRKLWLKANGRSMSLSALLASFTFWGVLFQTASAGVVVPMYILSFILSGAATPSAPEVRVPFTQQDAEAIIFGVIGGAMIPTIGMLMMNDATVTAIWQLFPFYVTVLKYLHLAGRPPKKGQDGKGPLIVLYVAAGIIAASTHIATTWPALGRWLMTRDQEAFEYLRGLWFPAKLYGSSWTSSEGQTLEFLQWDASFACVSAILGTFWFGSEWKAMIRMALWYVVAIPLLGPGAALARVFIWRELLIPSM